MALACGTQRSSTNASTETTRARVARFAIVHVGVDEGVVCSVKL